MADFRDRNQPRHDRAPSAIGIEAKTPAEALAAGFGHTFDAVTCWHVLEHVIDPRELARSARCARARWDFPGHRAGHIELAGEAVWPALAPPGRARATGIISQATRSTA